MILPGANIARTLNEELKQKIACFSSPPGLAVILVGEHPSSKIYVNKKRDTCENIGVQSFLYTFSSFAEEKEILEVIAECNRNPKVHGILVQLPLPKHINPLHVIQAIDPKKDIDGFHPENLGKLMAGLQGGFIPCTPLGIKVLLERVGIAIEGQHVVIVGRSAIVGKPLASLLMQNAPGCNATVTVVHSYTQQLAHYTKQADILVVAIGSPCFIKKEMIKKGVVIIDVGMNRQSSRLVGDVDYEQVKTKCRAITPVPGGVGPMTIAMLLHNTVLSYQRFCS